MSDTKYLEQRRDKLLAGGFIYGKPIDMNNIKHLILAAYYLDRPEELKPGLLC